MEILKRFIETAKSNPQRIVLPEGDEPRTLKAADRIIGDVLIAAIKKAFNLKEKETPVPRKTP